MNYMKFNEGGMERMMQGMQQAQQGGPSGFNLSGQYASPVMYDEETSREYVMYETEDGEEVKVYGNWNEYAVSMDEEGRDMIADEDYPVVQNEAGEYVMDEKQYEHMSARESGDTEEQMMAREVQGGPGASPMEDLMEKLNQYGQKRASYAHGGFVGESPSNKKTRTAYKEGMDKEIVPDRSGEMRKAVKIAAALSAGIGGAGALLSKAFTPEVLAQRARRRIERG